LQCWHWIKAQSRSSSSSSPPTEPVTSPEAEDVPVSAVKCMLTKGIILC
jgi:hypothetical protein